MKQVADWLGFYKIHSRHIGCGSDACRLLMINGFHHCHSATVFAQTEAVCQPQLAPRGVALASNMLPRFQAHITNQRFQNKILDVV